MQRCAFLKQVSYELRKKDSDKESFEANVTFHRGKFQSIILFASKTVVIEISDWLEQKKSPNKLSPKAE